MKRAVFLNIVFILFVFICFQSFAETVFEDELLTAGEDETIVFRNYSGPHKKIDTAEQILGIGRFLGFDIDRESAEFSYFGKYSIIHAVDYETAEGLDADILVLSVDAAVDHITNLRRIIAGYLESAYEYEPEQAEALSVFITVYNAVYRGNIDYFNEIYKDVVTNHLTAEKAGLALSWEEWPGATMIVIPLTPKAGTETTGDLDSDMLSGADVVERMREDEGQEIDARREIVDLKEDEILEEREEIQEERAELEQREEELTERIAEIEEQTWEAGDGTAETGAEEAAEEVREAERELEEIEEARAELEERETAVEEREESIVAEREAIADDQAEEISREEAAEEPSGRSETSEDAQQQPAEAEPESLSFLMLSGASGSYKGQLVLVEPESGKIVKRSDVDSIRLRGYSYSDDEIISVAGEDGGNRIVSIVRIDPDSLEIVRSGTDEVYIDSVLVKSGRDYYAVAKSGGRWRVGIFNKELELEKVSAAEVYPATEIILRGGDLLVQSPQGRIISIGPDDFSSPNN